MAANRFPAVWLRRFAGLVVLLGVLTLSACGGGSGAPNNPFAPAPPTAAALAVLPTAATVYPGVPATLTITGGTGPYRALSSNSALLPVAANVTGSSVALLASEVSADTHVTITVLDAAGQTTTSDVTISPTPAGAPLSVLPSNLSLQSGLPTTITISGGKGPYRAFSSNTAVLPVSQSVSGNSVTLVAGNVTTNTPVTITISDAAGNSTTATATVTPAATLTVTPSTATVYSGQASILYIAGGLAPYRAVSSNSVVLPVPNNVSGNTIALLPAIVSADTPVTVTITDAAGQTAQSTLTVRPAALLNTFTITANLSDCVPTGTGSATTPAVCSGQTGTASIVVLGPSGAPAPGRQVRFEVVQGPFTIRTTNPAVPSASSQTVTTDASGVATVIIEAAVNAPTQPAQIRVTDVQSGQQRTTSFIIQQVTSGSNIMTVVPGVATIQAVYKGQCSSDVRVDYYVYGGTPPYRVTSSFPDAVTLVNSVVATSGGFFEAITNGQCVDPLTFSIFDATGRQTTATLTNKEGTTDAPAPTPVPALAMTPGSVAAAACSAGTSYRFAFTGGTPPYNVFVSNPGVANVAAVPGNSGLFDVTFSAVFHGTLNVSAVDFTTAQKTVTGTITCP